MNRTPLQNVIDKLEKLRKESDYSPIEQSILYMVISKLWDELDNERDVLMEIFESGKNSEDISGEMFLNENFIDYRKML